MATSQNSIENRYKGTKTVFPHSQEHTDLFMLQFYFIFLTLNCKSKSF